MSTPPVRTTLNLFRQRDIPRIVFNGNITIPFSDIAAARKAPFYQCKVRDWPGFNAGAAQVLVGTHNRIISENNYQNIKTTCLSPSGTAIPTAESHLEDLKMLNVLRPCNLILSAAEPIWVTQISLGGNRRCGFSLISQNSGDIKVVGEIKRPSLHLGAHLSASWLQQRLRGNMTDLLRSNTMRPFLQCFAYMYESGTGLGILSNYNETRFFRMGVSENKFVIYMSPLVKVDQKLNGNHPHCLQTYLYAMNTYSTQGSLSNQQMQKFRSKREEMTNLLRALKIDEKTGKLKEPPKRAGGSSTGHKVRAYSNNYLERFTLDGSVTRVLEECEFIRTLGEGMTGTIDECEYRGKRVAVKIGRPYDPIKHHDNGFVHVEREMKMYKELTEVQGKYVPRMIVGGFENWHTLESNVLVVEKVGHQLVDRGDGLYVDGHKLSHEEAREIVVKFLEAVDAVHACGVVHGDTNHDNIRVGKINGKFHVWLIDFVLGIITDHEPEKSLDRVSFERSFPTRYFSNWTAITE